MSHFADVGWRRAGQCSSLRTSTAQLPRVSSVDVKISWSTWRVCLLGTLPAWISSAQRLSKKQTELRNESSNAKRFYPYRTDDCSCNHRYFGCHRVARISGLYHSRKSQ